MQGSLKCKSLVSFVLIFAIFMFSCAYRIYGTGGSEKFQNCELLAAEKSNFLFLTYDDESYCVYKLDKNENLAKTSSNNFVVKSSFFANGYLFLVGKHNKNLPITRLSGGGAWLSSVSIANFNPKEYCITAGKYDDIYAVDTQKPDTVYQYQIDGTPYKTYTLGKNIKSLFTDSSNANVFAVTDGGIFNVETGGFISCDVPTAPYNFSGNYVCDSSGRIFLFNSTTGFECVMQTNYRKLCVLNNTVYAAEKNTVYILDDSGKPEFKYELSSDVQSLCVSGGVAAVMYGNNVQILSRDDFDLIADENSNHTVSEISKITETSRTETSKPVSNHTSNPTSRPSENSSIQQSSNQTTHQSYNISSNKYNINNGMITDIPQGTTVAQLKRNINYGSNVITVTNHNNKIVTSGQIGTGWRIDFSGNGKTVSYYTVIIGDVTGEGNINSRDISALSDYLVGKKDLSVYSLFAADLNSDGVCNSLDLLLLNKTTKL